MADLKGRDLEKIGQQVFTEMGMVCVNPLKHVRLLDLEPSGPHSYDSHLEFDYLIPCGDVCLVGEISGRRNPEDERNKYRQFRRHYNIVRRLHLDERIWRTLGVPDKQLRNFRETVSLRGFFITSCLQRFDVDLPKVAEIARFFKSDWTLLQEYSQSIGMYAKHHFLHRFEIAEMVPRRSLTLREDSHNLMLTPNKRVASGDVGLADMFTFEASPYELLPIARVFRRDELPTLASARELVYQRPLIPKKLDEIRELLGNPDFMFPNSILVVLSSECQYSSEVQTLIIPETYGAISVIDGQHRLFSYANEQVQQQLEKDSKIMVTAIQFQDADEEQIGKYSARTFVEINTNQTPVKSTHLDAIAYEILGETHPRAIAAQVILRANERKGALYGLFDTNQTGLGIIRATTVLTALKSITRLEYIQRLQTAQRGSRLDKRRGYENIFGVGISSLAEAETLIEYGVVCFEHYFNRVKGVFPHDWPKRRQNKGSSLEYAKMIAGFVKLLRQFISEGLDWQAVQNELETIRANVMQLRGMSEYDVVLFDPTHRDIPDPQPSATDDFRFLNSNRENPVSIQDVLVQRRRR